ncbi:hypothetical protein TNCV_1643031 [Trichonephila clavipes]|nr:hypothetical protein TNCV_1643031 [Trichonephila clavipes]
MLEKVIENWTSRLDYIRVSRGSPMPEIIFKIFSSGLDEKGKKGFGQYSAGQQSSHAGAANENRNCEKTLRLKREERAEKKTEDGPRSFEPGSRTTPERTPHLQTTTPRQGRILNFDIFNVHQLFCRGVFSCTRTMNARLPRLP